MESKAYSKIVLVICGAGFLLGTLFSINFSRLVGVSNEYDIKRLIVIFCICFFSLLLTFVKSIEFKKVPIKIKLLGTIILLAGLYSSFMSKNPFFSGIELIYNGLLLIYFAFFVICMRALEKNKLYFGVYLYFLFFSIFTFVKYLLFLVFFYFDAKSFNIHELVYGYVNVRFFNQLQVMIIPILFWPFFHPECKRYKLASIIIISLHWVVLLQSEARGAALSLIISTGVLGYFLPSEKRFKLFFTSVKAFLFGGVLWLILIIIIPNWLMNVENLQLRTGSSGRIDLWFYSVKSIVDNIWFGFGPMSFAWAEGKPLYNAHPHNSVIQLLYEYGVVTWSVIVFGVFYFLRGKIQGLKCEYFQKTTPFLLSIFSGLIYSLFSGVIVMPFSQILLVFLVALVCHEGGAGYYKVRKNTTVILFISTLTGAGIILSSYHHEQLLPALFPRLWVNGLIG